VIGVRLLEEGELFGSSVLTPSINRDKDDKNSKFKAQNSNLRLPRRSRVPRILGIDLPKEKRIEISLTYLYGVGRSLSNVILKEANVDPNKRAKDLSEEEVSRITNTIQKSGFKVEGDLRRDISQNIKRLMDIGCWRGLRHKKGLPVRGQRTRTNARTRKGPRKGGMAVIKKAVEEKKALPAVKPAK
jgi:small subunit ribosomal protein S13